jgi:hypothetical protein
MLKIRPVQILFLTYLFGALAIKNSNQKHKSTITLDLSFVSFRIKLNSDYSSKSGKN